MLTPSLLARQPSIWAVSALELAQLVTLAMPDFSGRARIQVIHEHFEDAVALIRQRLKNEHCDTLISAGANADYLRSHLEIPVVSVRVDGYDVMAAITKATSISRKIALLLYRTMPQEIVNFASIFDIQIEFRTYETELDASNLVKELVAQGIGVVIGAGLVVKIAEHQDIASVFLYTKSSVVTAIDEAISWTQAKRAEKAQLEILSAVLFHLEDGIIAVDTYNRIVAANPAAEALSGYELISAVGTELNKKAPKLEVRSPFATGSSSTAVYQLQGETIVVDSAPIYESGMGVGSVLTLRRATSIEKTSRKLKIHRGDGKSRTYYTLSQVVQESVQMQAVVRRCRAVAAGDITVLIKGPTGVGKELLAQGIHHASSRRKRAFVAVNCGALTESLLESELFGYEDGAFTGARRNGKAGLIETADQGTLFLDEIAELPLHLQTRLLRVIQEREVTRVGAVSATPVDMRIIAATHRDLLAMVRTGTFRSDLYYRIAVLPISVPGLSERPLDIYPLCEIFLDTALRQVGKSEYYPELLLALNTGIADYPWPGNVRELENLTQRIAVACLEADAPIDSREIANLLYSDEPTHRLSSTSNLPITRRAQERQHVQMVLAACGGDQNEAAERLGISRSTLWRKLKNDLI